MQRRASLPEAAVTTLRSGAHNSPCIALRLCGLRHRRRVYLRKMGRSKRSSLLVQPQAQQ